MPAGDEDDGGLGEGPASHVNKMRDGGETRRGGHGPGGSSEGHQDVDDLLSQVEQTVALELKKKKKKKHIPKPTGIPGERQAVRSLRRPSNAPRPIGGLEMREMREAQSEPKNMNRLGRIHRHDAVAEGTRSRDPFGFSWRHITRNAFSIQSMWRRRRAQIRTEELETEVSKHRLEAARYRRRMYAAMASLVGVVCILFVVVYVAVQTSKDTTFHAGSAVLQVKATGEPVRVNAAEWHIDASGVARMRVPSDGGVGDGGGDAGGAASGAGSGSGSGTVVAQEVVKAFVLLSELTRASIHALSSVEAVTFTTRDDGAQHIFKGFSVRQYMREDGLAAVELKGPSWPLAGQAVRITNASAELLEIVGPGPKGSTAEIQVDVSFGRAGAKHDNLQISAGSEAEMDVNLSPMGFGPSSTVVEIEALLGRDKEDVKSRERVRTRGNVLTMTADVAYHTPIDEHGFVGTAGDVFVTPALAIRTIVGLPIRFSVDPPLGCTAYAGAEIKTWEILDGDNSEGEVRKYLSAYETDAKKIPETADAWNRERAKKEIAPSMEDEHWNTVSEVTVFDIVNVRIPQAQSSCAEARDLLWCNGGDDTATGWTSTLINKINNPYRPIKIKTLCGGQIDLQGVEDCVSTADRPRSRCGRKHDITFTSPFTSANPTHVNFCATKQKMAVPSGITNPSASNDDFCDGVVGSKTPWCEALLKLRVSVLGILGWRRAVELNEELKVAAGKVSQVFGGSPVLPQVPVLLPDGPSAGKRMQSQNEEPALDIDGSTGHGRRLFVQRKAIEAGINHLIGDPESHAGGRVHGLSAEQKEALESSFAAESEKLFDPVLNDKLKASASIMSFGGGGDEMTNTFETTTTRTLVIEAADETERGVGGIVHFGLTVSGVAMVQDGGIGGARQNSNARSVVRSVSETTAVVYTLGDEDIGDFFDVLVKRDPVYGTPVFRTLSGRSECAHEFGTASRHVWDTHFDVELNTLDVEGSSLNRKVRDLTRKTAPGTCIRFDMIIESFGLHVSYSYDTVTRLDWELIRPSDGDFAGVNAQIMDSGFAEMSALNTIFPGQSRRFRVRFCPATADGQGGPDNNFVARKKRLIKTGTYKKPGDEFVFCGLKVATVLMCENALGSDSGLTKLWMGEAKTKKGLRMCGDQVNIHGSMTPLGPCQDKILTNIFDKEDMALVEERVLDDAMVLRCVSFDRSRPCSVGDVQRECIGAGAPTPQPTPKPTPRPTLPPFDTSTLNPTTMPTPLTSASPTAAAVSPPTSEPTPHPSCGGAVGRDECAKVARYPSLCHTDKYKNSCWECGVCQ